MVTREARLPVQPLTTLPCLRANPPAILTGLQFPQWVTGPTPFSRCGLSPSASLLCSTSLFPNPNSYLAASFLFRCQDFK